MKKKMEKQVKIGWIVAISLLILLGLSAGIFTLVRYRGEEELPSYTFHEALKISLQEKEDAVLTVGTLKKGKSDFTVYGENGTVLDKELHSYELGSVTKPLVASLAKKVIKDGKLQKDTNVGEFLGLKRGVLYPTVEQLITHTSGYSKWYFTSPMIGNFFTRRNDYYGISGEKIAGKAEKVNLKENPEFLYSDFGYALLGLVLEKATDTPFPQLMDSFLTDLGMKNTWVSRGNGDLENYLAWKEDDAYLASSGLLSNVEDLLHYAQLIFSGKVGYGESLRYFIPYSFYDPTLEQMEKAGIRMDAVVDGWLYDEKNQFYWTVGTTENYNCYFGFSQKTETAVAVLSNLPFDDGLPAAYLGFKALEALQ